MTASYPASVKTFTSKSDGEVIYAAHVGDLQDEVAAIETAMGRRPRVFARYTHATTQNISNNSTTIINYNTQVSDSLSAVSTGAAWKFTAPTTGAYHVSAGLRLNNTGVFAAGEPYELRLYKNGSHYATLDYHDAYSATAAEYPLVGSTIASLAATDYVDVRLLQVSGATVSTRTSSVYCWCAVARV